MFDESVQQETMKETEPNGDKNEKLNTNQNTEKMIVIEDEKEIGKHPSQHLQEDTHSETSPVHINCRGESSKPPENHISKGAETDQEDENDYTPIFNRFQSLEDVADDPFNINKEDQPCEKEDQPCDN
ncbi:hypothetical protein Salat_1371900 [Sesamum alatum]|uniref:Uncharacterized protein n=1 Tax=Sesamum alatum TaxID=300844 RepID=A0AAE2CL80_9LAMI|nr:hypothetical protein Salat_1371900 [Sesamum alatum]